MLILLSEGRECDRFKHRSALKTALSVNVARHTKFLLIDFHSPYPNPLSSSLVRHLTDTKSRDDLELS